MFRVNESGSNTYKVEYTPVVPGIYHYISCLFGNHKQQYITDNTSRNTPTHTHKCTNFNVQSKFQPWTISRLEKRAHTYQSIRKFTALSLNQILVIIQFNTRLYMFQMSQAISITWTEYSKHCPIYTMSFCFLLVCHMKLSVFVLILLLHFTWITSQQKK